MMLDKSVNGWLKLNMNADDVIELGEELFLSSCVLGEEVKSPEFFQ